LFGRTLFGCFTPIRLSKAHSRKFAAAVTASDTRSHRFAANSIAAFLALAGAAAGTAHAGSMPRVWGQNNLGEASPPQIVEGVTAVATGGGHSLALLPDGSIRGWGANRFNGINFNYGQTVAPSDLGPCKAIAAGNYNSGAIQADGTVVMWGFADYGVCTVPSDVGASTAIAIGEYHGLALRENRTVRAWGLNSDGQCNVPAGIGACTAVAAGYRNSVALQAKSFIELLSDANAANAALTAANAALTTQLSCGDLDGDGEVGGADIGLVLLNFGPCTQ
jgi:alpha-tubulin suppressor-like RCC1 family protein